MNQETAIKKVMTEIRANGMVLPIWDNNIRQYLMMLYAIGHDEGSRIRSNRKPVYQMDKFGNIVNEFPSAAQASRSTKTDHSSIVNCCKSKQHTAGGYLWAYKSEVEKIKRSLKIN